MSPRWNATRPVLAVAAGVALAVSTTAGAAVPAPAVAIAGPQAATAGFVSKVAIATKGQMLTFVNADLSGHTLTSKATKKKLVRYGKKTYVTYVPLFDSDSVNAGATGDVKGVSALAPGTYEFYCALHTGMTGKLIVK